MPALKEQGLAADAYRRVREAILGGEFSPGEPLFEVHLAAQMGMSRTPVREAMRVLARDGLLQVIPARGYVIPMRSIDDVRELFELRESLEGMASRYAALRASDQELALLEELCARYERETDWREWAQVGTEFHNVLVAAARNERLTTILDSLKAQIMQTRRSSLRNDDARRDAAIREHRAILKCIKSKNPDEAEARARQHVRLSYQATLDAHKTTSRGR